MIVSDKKKSNSNLSLLGQIWGLIDKRRRFQIGCSIILMVVVAFFEVISISTVMPFLTVLISPDTVFDDPLIKPIIKILGFEHAREMLLPITILFILTVVISNGLRMFLYWLQLYLAHKIGSDFGGKIFRHSIFQSYEYHLQKNSSESISTIINKSGAIVGQAVLPLMVIISSLITLIAIAATLVYLNPELVIVCLISFGSIYLLIANYFKKKVDYHSILINNNSSLLIQVIQESIGGIRDIIIEHSQDVYCRAFKRIDGPLKRSGAIVLSMIGMPRFAIEGLGVITIAILAYYLTSLNPEGSTAVPFLGVIALGSQRLLPIMQQGYASWTTIRSGMPAFTDVITLLESPSTEYLVRAPDDLCPAIFEKELSLENIVFSYKTNSIDVLKGVSLLIPKGSKIGIVGTTGSGKSTLLDIIMGLISPTQGRVMIDGVALSEENIQNWRACIAHVPQHVYISDASIAENIAFGIPEVEINWERIESAIEGAELTETIKQWDHGYRTVVGERGARLSGGQRQRVGIARALYKNAQVIIFDEATSALDGHTESSIMKSLHRTGANLTIIMVAHRLTTLESCNYIFQLEQGKIISPQSYQNLKDEIKK
jgi:ATP-binding cassette subfamily B protein